MVREEIEKPASRWKLKRWQMIVLVVLIGALFRIWAAWQLPIDADEPNYLTAAQSYASLIKAGDLQGVINFNGNPEHPPLIKLMDSLPYLFVHPRFGSTTEMSIDRLISAFWGTMAVLVMALINPLAGFFLATDSMVVKYTSEVYLEALPLFAGLLAVYTLRRSFNSPGLNRWFWISTAAFGAAVSGKYLYVMIGFPLLALFLTRKKYRSKDFGLFVLAAMALFFVLNPYLWNDPFNRLAGSLLFHLKYTQGTDILTANYPWYQAFNWITAMAPWHPQVFFFPTPDLVIFILAVIGLIPEIRKNLWVVVWIFSSFVTLLFWPTKWPQYTLVLIPALCLAASSGFAFLAGRIREFEDTWHWGENVLPHPGKLAWGAAFLFVVVIGSAKIGIEVQQAQARAGWLNIRSEFSPLSSNKVNDIAFTKNGEVVLATDNGISFWPNTNWPYTNLSPWGDHQVNLTASTSGLADSQVNVLLQDSDSAWWFGTQNGLNYYNSTTGWKTYHAQDMGLSSSQINDLVKDNQGDLWVATNAGATVFDGARWKAYTQQNSALADNAVLSIAVQPGNAAWFGHLKGISRLDLKTGAWSQFDLSKVGFGWGGTTDLLVDHLDRVWAATTGSGLNVWDGKEWTSYRVSNSGIPQNNVTRILEDSDGTIWMGCSYSAEPGGLLASFNGKDWTRYDSSNSGYAGTEALSLTMDSSARLWIGTTTSGINIFQTKP